MNLIHQCDLTVNDRTIESTSSFINVARHFQLTSEMSINDVCTLGPTLDFAPTGLDSAKSMKFNSTVGTGGTSGNGLTNNRFVGTGDYCFTCNYPKFSCQYRPYHVWKLYDLV